MVYSIRSDKTIVSAVPLKKSRTQGEHSKNTEAFLKNHTVSVTRKSSGAPEVKVYSK